MELFWSDLVKIQSKTEMKDWNLRTEFFCDEVTSFQKTFNFFDLSWKVIWINFIVFAKTSLCLRLAMKEWKALQIKRLLKAKKFGC